MGDKKSKFQLISAETMFSHLVNSAIKCTWQARTPKWKINSFFDIKFKKKILNVIFFIVNNFSHLKEM